MADKVPTQAMPGKKAKHPGPRDESLIPRDERGAGGGGPMGPKAGGKPFRGGQSEPAYHGTGQLGEEPVPGERNVNAPDG